MQQPSSASANSPASTPGLPNSANSPTETVTRPEPGLARGRWEAPAWAFLVALVLVALVTTAYVLARLGKLQRKKTEKITVGPKS